MLSSGVTSNFQDLQFHQGKEAESMFQLFKIINWFEQLLNQEAKLNQVQLSTKMIELPYNLTGDKEMLSKLFFLLNKILFRNSTGQTLEVEMLTELKKNSIEDTIYLIIHCKISKVSPINTEKILEIINQKSQKINTENLSKRDCSFEVQFKQLVYALQGKFKEVN